jgi:hypothetical protein
VGIKFVRYADELPNSHIVGQAFDLVTLEGVRKSLEELCPLVGKSLGRVIFAQFRLALTGSADEYQLDRESLVAQVQGEVVAHPRCVDTHDGKTRRLWSAKLFRMRLAARVVKAFASR